MIGIQLQLVHAVFSISLMAVQCRMTFKIKNKCDKKRDITLLFDTNSINLESGGIHLINDGLHMHYQIIKQLLIRKEEACLNLALASLSSYPKSRLKVYNLRSVDTFFNMYHNDLHNVEKKSIYSFMQTAHSLQEKEL